MMVDKKFSKGNYVKYINTQKKTDLINDNLPDAKDNWNEFEEIIESYFIEFKPSIVLLQLTPFFLNLYFS